MKFLPYARLMRLPNVFSAFADILVGLSLTVYIYPDFFDRSESITNGILLLLVSGCLYVTGMIDNDIADVRIDKIERPFRPLPSKAISVDGASYLRSALFILALLLATAIGPKGAIKVAPTLLVALLLAISILFYNHVFKKYMVGPISMSACRFLNMLLGCTLAFHYSSHPRVHIDPGFVFQLSGTTALYIVGVTWFAKQEASSSRRTILALAGLVIAASVISAIRLPYLLQREMEFAPLPILLLLFLIAIGIPLVRAIRTPSPANVQAAVKRCILGLIVFDAILATIFVGWPGLLIALLLIPALVLGKWVYST